MIFYFNPEIDTFHIEIPPSTHVLWADGSVWIDGIALHHVKLAMFGVLEDSHNSRRIGLQLKKGRFIVDVFTRPPIHPEKWRKIDDVEFLEKIG